MGSSPSRDAAVSPAIGTILLVAFTVVFVVIVTVIAMGLADGMFDAKDVGLVLDTYATGGLDPEHGVVVTVMGGKDAGDITEMRVSIGDPSLYYKKRGDTYVPNPVTGIPYRYFADNGTYLKLYDKTWVMTNELNNTGVLENRLVTVTGKFRDATEQVLLMKMITIPAMVGVNQQFNYDYVRVLTFTNTTGVPGHGLLVTPINESVTGITNISVSREGSSETTVLKGPHQHGNEYFFYMPTEGIFDSPYTTHPNADRLKGTAIISVTLKDAPSPAIVSVDVDIPARINFFDGTSMASGEFGLAKKETGNNYYTVSFTITESTLSSPQALTAYVNYGNGERVAISNNVELTESNSFEVGRTYNLGASLKNFDPYKYPQGTLDVFVRSGVDNTNTQVWYRIASASVSSLLPSP
ncbi:hypothetical protein McpSp1_17010 [Methanocorpusculaceae archaeon Sp1]|nr:hypothetical protein [Methanocorpusculaceae archaeon Sp1]